MSPMEAKAEAERRAYERWINELRVGRGLPPIPSQWELEQAERAEQEREYQADLEACGQLRMF